MVKVMNIARMKMTMTTVMLMMIMMMTMETMMAMITVALATTTMMMSLVFPLPGYQPPRARDDERLQSGHYVASHCDQA